MVLARDLEESNFKAKLFMQTSFNVLGGDIKPPDLKADLHVFIHLFTQCIFIERLSIPSEDTDKSM